jgi:hypothetical protein
MTMPLLSPVFTAEPRALADMLAEENRSPGGANAMSEQVITVLKTVIPDVEETPARMKRLNDALGKWLLKGTHSWYELEDIRKEFQDIFETNARNVDRVLIAATQHGFPPDELAGLQHAQAEMQDLRGSIFSRWQAFTQTDYEASLGEIERGEVHDLDEVIRELQSRPH